MFSAGNDWVIILESIVMAKRSLQLWFPSSCIFVMLCDVLRVLSCLYNMNRRQGPTAKRVGSGTRVVPKCIFRRKKLVEGGPRLRQMISCKISICKISGMSRTGEAKEDFTLHTARTFLMGFKPRQRYTATQAFPSH